MILLVYKKPNKFKGEENAHFQKCQRGPKVKGLPLPNLPADPPPLGRKRSYLSSLRWRGPPSSHQRFEISDNREERPHPHVGNPGSGQPGHPQLP